MESALIDNLNKIEQHLQQIIQEYDTILASSSSNHNNNYFIKLKEEYIAKRGELRVMRNDYKQQTCKHEFTRDIFDVCPEFSVEVTYCKKCELVVQD